MSIDKNKLLSLGGAQMLYDNLRDEIKKASSSVEEQVGLKADYIRITDDGKYFYLVSGGEGGEDIAGPFGPFAGEGGGGGGGSGNNAVLTLTNENEGKWKTKTVPQGSMVFIEVEWSSIEDDEPTGPGTLTVKLNGRTVQTRDVEQGRVTIKVNDFVTSGTANKINVSVSDVYDNIKTIGFTVNFVEYALTSAFNFSKAYKDDIDFSYRASGEGDKVMHFFLDGVEFLTKTVSTNNREDTIVIPKENINYPEDFKWHGDHVFEAFFEVDAGGSTIQSDSLIYDLICYDPEDTTPIISSLFDRDSIMQYSNLEIPYYVFNTTSSTSTVEYFIDGISQGIYEGIPQGIEQTWVYRVSDIGNHVFRIQCGETFKEFPVKVEKLNVDVEAETQQMILHLSSENRSNQEPEERRTNWSYEGISAQFENFNWGDIDGWQRDEKNLPVMRVKDDARITIPLKPFNEDFKENGRTFEFEFSTSSVFNYDTELISCYSGNIGFKITAQQALFASSTSVIRSQYKENEHVRISFVISKESNNRLIYCYINGIISGIVRYPTTDDFRQLVPVNITIGSNDAIIDIYRIRIYKKDLSRFQMVNNWIADMQDSEELLKQYNLNSIYDNNDLISLDKVRTHLTQLPYIVIETATTTDKKGKLIGHLPTYKGEKLLCNGYYVNPVEPRLSFSWKNGEIDVQGTSSQAYPIKNFKLKIKKSDTYGKADGKATDCSGFIMTELSEAAGKEVIFKKYSMRGYGDYVSDPTKYKKPLSIETNTFVFKADYASSEGANNVELVRYYNDNSIYQTPPQVNDNRYRQGIDGFPMIWFGDDGEKISFIGKYNFNNHKGTDEVYGLNYGGETYEEDDYSDYHRVINGAPDESWEVTDNNSLIALWRRLAGDATKTIIKTQDGQEVQYDAYLVNENLETVKEISLRPMYLGTHEVPTEDHDKYISYVNIWQEKYENADEWIINMAITSIHDAGDTLDDDVREQRDFAINLMKADIREHWNLIEYQIPISPEEDMLGERGRGESVAHSFEVRFPSEWYDAHTEGQPSVVRVDRFVNLQRWVISTDQNKATGEVLETPVTYEGVEYTKDTAQYRLAKFRNEFSKYFNLESTLYYYIFTETFLMIDSRVKNSFPTYFSVNKKVRATDADTGEYLYEVCADDEVIEKGVVYYKRTDDTYEEFPGTVGNPAKDNEGNPLYVSVMTEVEDVDENGWPKGRWCWLPYDMDTAIGINNEGLLVFDYSLEDTEALKGNEVVPYTDPTGVPVYNGATSVLWRNFREAFPNEIENRYFNLRAGTFGYDSIEQEFEKHQSLWPAAVFNEDAYYKYIKPLIETGENRLGMCLGSKEQQRKWWLYNRFRFLDSKYAAGDARANTINFRVNDLEGDRTVGITPYADIYVKVKQGEQWQSKGVKTYRNKKTNVFIDVPEAGDTEAYIYSADQIKEVEGLNKNLHISTLSVKAAVNLQHLDVSAGEGLVNRTLTELSVGANKLLRSIDARNCIMLGETNTSSSHVSTSVDLEDCDQLEEAYFTGTKLQSVVLPAGGRIRKVWLPGTITSLNIVNQKKIEDLRILDIDGTWNTSNITTLEIGNVNKYVQQIAIDIIEGLPTGSVIKFTGFDIEVADVAALKTFMDKLDTLKGKEGEDTNIATVSGKITVLDKSTPLDWESYNHYRTRYKDVIIDTNVAKTVKFFHYNGSPILDNEGHQIVKVHVGKADEVGSVIYDGDNPTRPDLTPSGENPGIHYDWNGWAITEFGTAEDDILNRINKDYNLYSAFQETPIYEVRFWDYRGEALILTKRIIGEGDITLTDEEFNLFGTYGSVPKMGWGTIPYGSDDVDSSADFKTIKNVDKNMTVYLVLDWPLNRIWIETPPTKINYLVTEVFDTTGMILKGEKNTDAGAKETVLTKYEYNQNPLTSSDTTMTFRVKNQETTLTIGIGTSMSIETLPVKLLYFTGDEFETEGLTVRVTYSNGQEEIKDSGFLWFPEVFDEVGTITVTLNLRLLVASLEVLVVERIYEDLELNSWQTISAVCDNGTAQNYWHIGQTKSVNLGEFDYKTATSTTRHTPQRDVLFRIVAFNHNKDFESPGQNTITFGFVGFINNEGVLAETAVDSGQIGKAPMNHSESPRRGGLLVDYLNSMLTPNSSSSDEPPLAKELVDRIKTVTKGQLDYDWDVDGGDIGGLPGTYYANILGTYQTKLFIPSMYEIFGSSPSEVRGLNEGDVCQQFEYYRLNADNPSSRIKKTWNESMIMSWWTRTFIKDIVSLRDDGTWYDNYRYGIINESGNKADTYSAQTAGVVPFFNI